jgi:hypothetical protein
MPNRLPEYFLLWALLLADSSSASAQANSAAPDPVVLEQAVVSPLPAPRDALPHGVVIGVNNIQGYRSWFIPELLPVIRDAGFQVDAVDKLQFGWRYDDVWEQASTVGQAALNADGTLGSISTGPGLAFGNSEVIAKRPGGEISKAILWNINSNFWARKSINFDFDLIWPPTSGPDRRIHGDFSRIYPATIAQDTKTGQLFRERIRLLAPPPIKGFSYLTFRFLSDLEDAFWVSSPAIGKVRQLTGLNRADPILRTSISPDDFMTWSGKVELLDATLDKSVTALAPFPSLGPTLLTTSEQCSTVNSDRIIWNAQSRRFINGSGWLPSNIVFAPRTMWRLEVLSRDPFLAYGRQVLYVDVLSMLPVYKIVYSRTGKLLKTIMTGWGLASNKANDQKVPYPAFTLVYDHQQNQGWRIEYSNIQYGAALSEQLKLSDFDPHHLIEAKPGDVKGDNKQADKTASSQEQEAQANND